ncbi:hypothetical protein CWB73_00495 [Pseudoalteromonas phenolica]|uniref:Uncharacterized protein n=1 Tax=Pseudoalteromonas phenolica TaxID=161398 RepID=A0A5S3YZG6_9GAMM|nr:hypothetical protein [Pseudoalteromonas phenolica]TMP84179.1 hypothetical protein CWB73_00495 [Pseudoalteromonas phenolica]
MSDIPNITSVVNSATELLDDIRGGAITRMKAQHEQALDNFGDEKAQKLSEFNNQKTSALNDLANRANAVIESVESHLAESQDQQTHMRLTKNQALIPSPDGSFPLHWTKGHIKAAKIIETVESGTPVNERSHTAREFLSAINCDVQYFAGRFHIWELEINPHRVNSGGQQLESYFLYQSVRYSSAITMAAVVKHISGVIPSRFFCEELQANAPAKLCGVNIGIGSTRNSYLNTTSQVHGQHVPLSETTVIQIALPAVVTGNVDIKQGAWGQFPFIGEQAYD